jgi:hypothetical protein
LFGEGRLNLRLPRTQRENRDEGDKKESLLLGAGSQEIIADRQIQTDRYLKNANFGGELLLLIPSYYVQYLYLGMWLCRLQKK